MLIIALSALLVLTAALYGRAAGRAWATEAPIVEKIREYRVKTAELRSRKCLPRIRPLLPAHAIPPRWRPVVAERWRMRWVRSQFAGQHCLPVDPKGKPGTVELGKHMAEKAGWTGSQWECLHDLWDELESRWYVYADNPSSSAYGIPQALPGSKMGAGWQHSARVQIRWGLGYVRGRYGTPCGALSFRLAHGWY
jgi:hypothetical protein